MSRGRPAPLVKFQQFIQLFTVLLTAILISLFFGVLVLVGKIQGTARVVNYAGLVRGKTQRIVKPLDAKSWQRASGRLYKTSSKGDILINDKQCPPTVVFPQMGGHSAFSDRVEALFR
ncbi:MAG: hypothetical protein ACLUGP_12140 [Faecalibacterium prausnitzii]